MNKYLREIEIAASNTFGEDNARVFIEETRHIVSGVNCRLGKSVKSNYGKFAVLLWPQSVLEKFSLPPFEYDDMSGVCVRNISYDLEDFLGAPRQSDKDAITVSILCEVLSGLTEKVGMQGSAVIDILDKGRQSK